MIRTVLCDLLGVEHPIIQAGMGPGHNNALCAAVAEAGAQGLLSGHDPVELAKGRGYHELTMENIRYVMERTERTFGQNVPLASDRAQHVIRAVRDARRDPAIARQLRVFVLSAGFGGPLIGELKGEGMVVGHVVPSVYHARKVAEAGVDFVIAAGYEGGGHQTPEPVHTFVLTPAVVETVPMPVVASGGCGDGRTLVAALALGAQGMQMGTRFLATADSDFHPHAKAAILRAGVTDTIVTRGSFADARMLKGNYSLGLKKLVDTGASMDEIAAFKARYPTTLGTYGGDVEQGHVPSGQVAGRIHDLPTVAELVARVMREAEEILVRLGGLAVAGRA